MTALHQILAIERGVAADAERKIALATKGIEQTGEQSPLTGLSRSYKPRADEGDALPPQYQHVQISLERDVLPMIAQAMTRFLDVKFTREASSAAAKADVVIADGGQQVTLLSGVPVGYLLGLETELDKLAALVKKLPVLDPAEEWHWDAAKGCYATEPKVTARNIRVPQVQVLYEATPEHPAQVRPYETEKPAGDWTTIKLSGALPFDRVQAIYTRVRAVGEAVKLARESANRIDATDRAAGQAIFDYILGRDGVASSTSTASSSS
jgi:hypothetical protein